MRIATLLLLAMSTAATAGWDGETTPQLRAWFESLKMPDKPMVSCCGDYDAYYADDYYVEDGKVIAIITDDRGHSIPVGTKVVIPPEKVNRDPNITGHTIVFLGARVNMPPAVYCFIPSSGV